jgi:L-seryl-tRNA(Ser) seleniumtransferase
VKNFYKKNNLTPIINVSGFMTKIGASITNSESIKAAKEIFTNFVNIDELQAIASKRISKHLNAEAAVITASAAAGLTESVASMMTGNDLIKIFKLPNTNKMKNKVLIQKGHLTNYGAEVRQGIELSGAKILSCGLKDSCSIEQLEKSLSKNNKNIACAMYVVSHHCSEYNAVEISKFIKLCKKYKIPTIVDAASEEYMEKFFKIGTDIAIFSAHKFMGSLTAGILAGKRKYVKNIYLQNLGIGRGMKVGKEAIFAAIIGVENWYKRDWKKEIDNQNKIIKFWIKFLEKENFKGISFEIVADPTGNKINRLRIYVNNKRSKYTIQSLSYHLEKNDPAIFVRDDLIHLNHFELDTCNLKKGQEKIVAKELKKIIIKLSSNKIKNNITKKEHSIKSRKEFLSWLN